MMYDETDDGLGCCKAIGFALKIYALIFLVVGLLMLCGCTKRPKAFPIGDGLYVADVRITQQ